MQAFAFLGIATICHKTRKEAKSCCDPIAQTVNPQPRSIVSLSLWAFLPTLRTVFFETQDKRPPIE